MIGKLLPYSGWTTMGSTFPSPTLLQPTEQELRMSPFVQSLRAVYFTTSIGESIWQISCHGTHNMVKLA